MNRQQMELLIGELEDILNNIKCDPTEAEERLNVVVETLKKNTMYQQEEEL